MLGLAPGQKQYNNQSGISIPAVLLNQANINLPATATASKSLAASLPKS